MSVTADRANSNGSLNANGTFGRVVVLVDIGDILAMVGVPNGEKRRLALKRALEEFQRSFDADGLSDATINQQVTDAQSRAAAQIAARPTGTL